jgi:hypothetical protein
MPMRHTNEKEVGQITHNSIVDAETSCDRFRLRVKSEPFIGSSIVDCSRQQAQRRSKAELSTDSHSRRAHAEDNAPKQTTTPVSRGTFPCGKPAPIAPELLTSLLQNAGPAPAFLLRAPSASSRPDSRRTEFISVSGQCAARSALSSVMRTKRISGGAAATEHLRAPMNSPTGGVRRAAGFLL